MTGWDDVVAHLTGLGSRHQKFNQGKQREGAVADGLVDGGYCKGVCMDWARRVTQGHGPRFTQKGAEREQHQARRQASMQMIEKGTRDAHNKLVKVHNAKVATANETNAERSAAYDERFAAYKAGFADYKKGFAAYEASHEALSSLRSRLVELHNSNLSGGAKFSIQGDLFTAMQRHLGGFGRHLSNDDGTYPRKVLADAMDELSDAMKRLSPPTAPTAPDAPKLIAVPPLAPTDWRAQAQIMTHQHRVWRQSRGKGPSSRPFSNLVLQDSSERTNYGSIKEAIKRLTRVPAFTVGRVLMLGFGMKSQTEDTGHAVASKRVAEDLYHFLDPNYGVFQYSGSKLREALRYLFHSEANGHTAIYDEDPKYAVTGMVSHMIFAKSEA